MKKKDMSANPAATLEKDHESDSDRGADSLTNGDINLGGAEFELGCCTMEIEKGVYDPQNPVEIELEKRLAAIMRNAETSNVPTVRIADPEEICMRTRLKNIMTNRNNINYNHENKTRKTAMAPCTPI